MKPRAVWLLLCLPTLLFAQEPNAEAVRRGQLKHLAGAIKGYEIIHDNKPPARLSDLYRDGLADSFGDFVRPGSGTSITMDSEIDTKSDYTMESLPELKELIVREKNPEKDQLLAIAKDGTIKIVSVTGQPVAKTTPSASISPQASQGVVEAKPTPAASVAKSATPAAVVAATPQARAQPTEIPARASATSAASASELVEVPGIDGASGVGSAARLLSAAGFKPLFAAAKSKSKTDEFKIAGQSPRPGEKKPRGSVVTVYVYQKYEDVAAAAAGKPANTGGEQSGSAGATSSSPATGARTTPPLLGSFPSPPIRSLSPQANGDAARSASSQTNLMTLQQMIVGTWQGPQHRVQYFADGTLLLDGQPGQNGARSHWRVNGDELITSSPQGTIKVYKIASITNGELVVHDEKGTVSRLTRVSNTQ